MKPEPAYLLALLLMGFACSTPQQSESNETANTEEEVETTEYIDEMGDVVRGFDTIEELTASLIASLKDKNYRDYLSHTMTEEMELALAETVTDSIGRQKFIAEYGFSLREEKHYFDFTIKYFEEHEVDIANAMLDDIDYLPYKSDRYAPLELFEVFIPVETSGFPETIDLVVIKVDDKYYMTSEIGI